MWLLCACVAEDITIPGSQEGDTGLTPSGVKRSIYLNIRLDMVGGVPYTRDDPEPGDGETPDEEEEEDPEYELVDGDPDESRINNFLIIFYDEDGNYLDHYSSESVKRNKKPDETEFPSVEEYKWKTVIPIQVDLDEVYETGAISDFFTIVNYGENIYKETENIVEVESDGEKKTKTVITYSGLLADQNNNTKLKSFSEIRSIDNPTTSFDVGSSLSISIPPYMSARGFIMTSPGHYNSDGEYRALQEMKDGVVVESPAELKTANPLTVYVERLASRIDLDFGNNVHPIEVLYGEFDFHDPMGKSEASDVYELHFTADAWGIEAEEKTEFLAKKHPASFLASEYPTNFETWINCTDAGRRTFWAQSPSFENGKYPVWGDGNDGEVTLNYATFGALTNGFSDESDSESHISSTYTSEHTFRKTELTSSKAQNPYAVPTSFVLRGYYTVKYAGTDRKEDAPEGAPKPGTELSLNYKGFYIRDIDYERTDKEAPDDDYGNSTSKKYRYRLYREDNGSSHYSDDLFVGLIKEQHILFTKEEIKHEYIDDHKQPQTETITIWHPVKISTLYGPEGDQKELAPEVFLIANTYRRYTGKGWANASNTYTLQLNSFLLENLSQLPELYYAVYPEKDSDYKKISNIDDIRTVNEELLKQLGYAQKYYNGYSFFYAPITHYTGEYAPYSSSYGGLFNYQTSGGAYTTDLSGNPIPDHLTGDFGVVRNHVYEISIGKISSLGYGIPDFSTIPLPEPRIGHETYQLDLELKILPWNVFQYTFNVK